MYIKALNIDDIHDCFEQDIKRVLRRFGSNFIFFNGLRDPWSGGGHDLSHILISVLKGTCGYAVRDYI
jgi:hypothetical protein